MQARTKFESLPNELLIQCFEHLHATDIFHSFDQLNWRFFTLIRTIPLHFNIGKVDQCHLRSFGVKMLLNPGIKEQIISLTLTKNDTFNPIEELLSFSSLDEFSQLQSVVFLDVNTTCTNRLCSMLPLLSNLRYLCIKSPSDFGYEVLELLSSPTIQRLSIYTIPNFASDCHFFMSLTHLTVSSCSVNGVCDFLRYSPSLQYLNITYLLSSYVTSVDESQIRYEQAIHLKRLVIDDTSIGFDTFAILALRTPNLRSFKIRAYNNFHFIDGHGWHALFRGFIPLLDDFKFVFRFSIKDEDRNVVDKLQRFQHTFSVKQHHWCTEYILGNDEALIYTVPYMLDTYEIMPKTKRYYSHGLNKMNVFEKVTNLTVNTPTLIDVDQYYFPNIKSLRLINERERIHKNEDESRLESNHIPCLTTILNLCRLNHLEISSQCYWISTSIILQSIKDSLNLSSFKTDMTILFLLLKSRNLECLKMIKRLDVTGRWLSKHLSCEAIANICQTFTNMEEFQCTIDGLNVLQATLNHLSKLPRMRVFSYDTPVWECAHDWLKDHQLELDSYSFTINCKYYEVKHNLDENDSDSSELEE